MKLVSIRILLTSLSSVIKSKNSFMRLKCASLNHTSTTPSAEYTCRYLIYISENLVFISEPNFWIQLAPWFCFKWAMPNKVFLTNRLFWVQKITLKFNKFKPFIDRPTKSAADLVAAIRISATEEFYFSSVFIFSALSESVRVLTRFFHNNQI